MHAFAGAGSSFLVAVLWFDLMFDVQVRGHRGETLPPHVLDSIANYYRRVTTDARPMGQLVSLVMIATIAAIGLGMARSEGPAWVGLLSLALALGAIGLAVSRTVRNAVTLGSGQGSAEARTRLARSIYRDHLFCISFMTSAAGLQLFLH